jgi:serine/threonine-protein kinase RsbW
VLEGDEVRLTVAAEPELLRVARLAVAGLAGRLGFDLDEVEDLKIAVDEACFSLVGQGGGAETLTLTYRPLDDGLVIDVVVTGGATGPAESELSAQILAAVVDEHTLSSTGDEVGFRLVKRRARPARV